MIVNTIFAAIPFGKHFRSERKIICAFLGMILVCLLSVFVFRSTMNKDRLKLNTVFSDVSMDDSNFSSRGAGRRSLDEASILWFSVFLS